MNRMTNSPEKELYLQWLCNKVARHRSDMPDQPLFLTLFETEFYEVVPNDDNRAKDGLVLRERFASKSNCNLEALDGPCSVLEMMVALSERISKILEDGEHHKRPSEWFWEMVRNLRLQVEHNEDDNSSVSNAKALRNEMILKDFVDRRYAANGKGGLFPLKRYTKDQRHVEIWYQLQAYLEENYREEDYY